MAFSQLDNFYKRSQQTANTAPTIGDPNGASQLRGYLYDAISNAPTRYAQGEKEGQQRLLRQETQAAMNMPADTAEQQLTNLGAAAGRAGDPTTAGSLISTGQQSRILEDQNTRATGEYLQKSDKNRQDLMTDKVKQLSELAILANSIYEGDIKRLGDNPEGQKQAIESVNKFISSLQETSLRDDINPLLESLAKSGKQLKFGKSNYAPNVVSVKNKATGEIAFVDANQLVSGKDGVVPLEGYTNAGSLPLGEYRKRKDIDNNSRISVEKRLNVLNAADTLRTLPSYTGPEQTITFAKTIYDLVNSGNPLAKKQLEGQLTKSSGEVGQLSNYDKQGSVEAQGLLDTVGQYIQKLTDGDLSETNKSYVRDLVGTLVNSSYKRRNEAILNFYQEVAKNNDVSLSEAISSQKHYLVFDSVPAALAAANRYGLEHNDVVQVNTKYGLKPIVIEWSE